MSSEPPQLDVDDQGAAAREQENGRRATTTTKKKERPSPPPDDSSIPSSMSSPRSKRRQLEELLVEWDGAVSEYLSLPRRRQQQQQTAAAAATTTAAAAAAVERMNDLYRAWFDSVGGGDRRHSLPSSSKKEEGSGEFVVDDRVAPFEILLKARSRYVPDGPAALELLQDWYRRHAGDLELAPTREHYHAVLRAFAASSSADAAVDGGAAERQRQQMAAHVAREIWIQLKEWGYSMSPNATTHRLTARNIANALSPTTATSAWTTASPYANDADDQSSEAQEGAENIDRNHNLIGSTREHHMSSSASTDDNNGDDSAKDRELLQETLESAVNQLLHDFCEASGRSGISAFHNPQRSRRRRTGKDDSGAEHSPPSSLRGDILSQFLPWSSSSSSSQEGAAIGTRRSDDDGGDSYAALPLRPDLSRDELIVVLLTLCDGLRCCYVPSPQLNNQGKKHAPERQCHPREYLPTTWKQWLLQLRAILERKDMKDIVSSELATPGEYDKILQSLSVATSSIQRMSVRLLQDDDSDDGQSPDTEELVRAATSLLGPLEMSFPERLPTMYHYQMAIQALKIAKHRRSSRLGDVGDGDKYQDDKLKHYLDRMEEVHRRIVGDDHGEGAGERDLLPPAHISESWNRLMMANYDAKNIRRVHQIWQIMSSSPHIRRNNLSFSVILKALADEGTVKAASQAHSILKRMTSRPFHERFLQPDAQQFASVMITWSRSRHEQAGKLCQEVFDLMVEESKHDPKLKPTAVHYSALLGAWGRQKDDQDAVNRILSIFLEMEKAQMELDPQSYVAVLSALGRTRSVDGATQAQELLDRLENASSTTNEDDNRSAVQLNRHHYVSVMYAWANAPTPLAYDKCEAILERLEEMYRRYGSSNMLPNSFAYRALIVALSNASPPVGEDGNAKTRAFLAEEILDRVEDSAAAGMSEPPDCRLFTAVMTMHEKSGDPNAVQHIERVLDRMKEAYEAGNAAAKPDAWALTTMLNAYGASNVPDKATFAYGMLRQMCDAYEQGDLDMRPSARAFKGVLQACAFTSTDDEDVKDEVVRIALAAMNELDDGPFGKPDQYAYRRLLQVVGRHVVDLKERTRIAGVIFHRCCQEGHVNPTILRELRQNVPELYRKLPMNSEKKPELPAQWTRRARRA